MSIFEDAVRARFTLVSVTVDDPAFFKDSAESLLGIEVFEFSNANKTKTVTYSTAYEPTNAEIRECSTNKRTLILVNYQGSNPAVYDAGVLPTPLALVESQFKKVVGPKYMKGVLQALNGLSFTKAKQTILLAEARNVGFSYAAMKAVRTELYGTSEGLTLLPVESVFYEWSEELLAWADLGLPFFLEGDLALAPRGVLLHGQAGTGKTMAAKAISETLKIPAYRLDISASLSKWQGESEARIRQHLAFVEHEAPCVLLIDEIEKVISYSNDEPSSARILAQLLWWMAEHKSRVLTILTSNDISKLPPELYRSGRLDRAIEIGLLSAPQAIELAQKWVWRYLKTSVLVEEENKDTVIKYVALHLQEHLTEPCPAAQAIETAKTAVKTILLTLHSKAD